MGKPYTVLTNLAILITFLLSVGQAYTKIQYGKDINYLWQSEDSVIFDFTNGNQNTHFSQSYHTIGMIKNRTEKLVKYLKFNISSSHELDVIDFDKSLVLKDGSPKKISREGTRYIYEFAQCVSLTPAQDALVRLASSRTINSISVSAVLACGTCPPDIDYNLPTKIVVSSTEDAAGNLLLILFVAGLSLFIYLSIKLYRQEGRIQAKIEEYEEEQDPGDIQK